MDTLFLQLRNAKIVHSWERRWNWSTFVVVVLLLWLVQVEDGLFVDVLEQVRQHLLRAKS